LWLIRGSISPLRIPAAAGFHFRPVGRCPSDGRCGARLVWILALLFFAIFAAFARRLLLIDFAHFPAVSASS
jgi:hypothetical protein